MFSLITRKKGGFRDNVNTNLYGTGMFLIVLLALKEPQPQYKLNVIKYKFKTFLE